MDDLDRFCLKCSYSLRGLSENRCPECGKIFEPHNPATFSPLPLGPKQLRFLDRPVAWMLNTFTLATVALCVWAHCPPTSRFPRAGLFEPELTICLLGIPMVFLALRGVIWMVARYLCRRYGRWIPPLRSRWTLVPMIVLSALVLLVLDVPRQATFWLGRSALNRLVERAKHLPPGTLLPDQRVGLYEATEITVTAGGVRFCIISAGDLFEKAGLIFRPVQKAEPFRGDWQIWRENTFRLF